MKIISHDYLKDKDFLRQLDKTTVQEQYVKITLLDFMTEEPIKSIEGLVSSGSITKDGSSAVRRTCSLGCSVSSADYNFEDIEATYSIKRKVFIELGIENNLQNSKYADEIIWFPQGVMIISEFSLSNAANGAMSLSMKFKDKMAMLDGTIGGTLPSTVRFDTVSSINSKGVAVTEKALVYDIILEAVNHFGGEDINNIVIDDVPLKAKRIIRWDGSSKLYLIAKEVDNNITYEITLGGDKLEEQLMSGYYIEKEYTTKDDIGFVYEDMVYDQELTMNAGSTVTQLLDILKNWLGNFEYFYDEYGVFHFQEIKNYLNNSLSTYEWNQSLTEENYSYDTDSGKAVYTFGDTDIVSINVTPNYGNIKNDYIVLGNAKNSSGSKFTVTYHLAIDEKPSINIDGYDNILVYLDDSIGKYNLTMPTILDNWDDLTDDDKDTGIIYGVLNEKVTKTINFDVTKPVHFTTAHSNIWEDYEATNNIPDENLSWMLQNYIDIWLQQLVNNSDYNAAKNLIPALYEWRCINGNSAESPFYDGEGYENDVYSKLKEMNTSSPTNENILLCAYFGDPEQGLDVVKQKEDFQLLIENGKNIYESRVWPHNFSPDSWDNLIEKFKIIYEDAQEGSALAGGWYAYKQLLLETRKYIDKLDSVTEFITSRLLDATVSPYYYNIDTTAANNKTGLSVEDTEEKITAYISNITKFNDRCVKEKNLLYALQTASYDYISDITNKDLIEILEKPDVEYYFESSEEVQVYDTTFQKVDTVTENWKAVDWVQFWHTIDENTKLAPYTFIDYENEDSIDFLFFNDNIKDDDSLPTMKSNEDWYLNYYIDYAKNNDLDYVEYKDGQPLTSTYIANDWRTELLLQGMQNAALGIEKSYYYEELAANWPVTFNLYTKTSYDTVERQEEYIIGNAAVLRGDQYSFIDSAESDDENQCSTDNNTGISSFNDTTWIIRNAITDEGISGYYYLDFIDASSTQWGKYSIQAIGRRTNVDSNDEVNCLFARETPNFGFIDTTEDTSTQGEKRAALQSIGCDGIIQINPEYISNISTGGSDYAAYDVIRYDLVTHTNFQDSISLTVRPIYYLEPNTRITLDDNETIIHNDYMISTITIPLGAGQNMSINATKAIEKI